MKETNIPGQNIDWDQLIDYIDAKRVVPVVSKELLTSPGTNGGGLYAFYAQRLAEELRVSAQNLTSGWEINDVACRYLAMNRNSEDPKIYSKMNRVVTQCESLPCPAPLLQLAEILPLQLFVSTTFDSSMTRALNQVRFKGQPGTRVVSYTRSKQDDLPADPNALAVPTVFHLFGKATVTPEYAITQWDLVEYFHDLYTGPRPDRLLDELREKSLLILGSSFDGWLTRFFLRISKGSVAPRVQVPDYIADLQMNADNNLVLFIKLLRGSTEIYSAGGPIQFVNELYERWKRVHPDVVPGGVPGPSPPPPPASPKGAVFLSYAKEDRAAVEKIKSALVAAGVDVFVDYEALQYGQDYELVLERSINEACLFIAVVSRHSLTEKQRYVYYEWRLAIRRALRKSFLRDASYLIPVIVDATPTEQDGIPEEFQAAQLARLPGGETSSTFVSRVQTLYRRYTKALAEGGA